MQQVQQEDAVGTAADADYDDSRRVSLNGKESVVRLIRDKCILHRNGSQLRWLGETCICYEWDYTTAGD